MRLAIALALTAASLPVFGAAAQIPEMPYDSLMSERSGVDAVVDREDGEYPASFTDKTTGITVSWGFDDSMMYLALESKGQGWLAIGFGSAKMNESNIIIGYYTEDSSDVLNQVGVNNTHAALADSTFELDECDIDWDEETNTTTMEFVYPLKFPPAKGLAVSGLVPGDKFDLILARNAGSASLDARHGQKSSLEFTLAGTPRSQAPEKK